MIVAVLCLIQIVCLSYIAFDLIKSKRRIIVLEQEIAHIEDRKPFDVSWIAERLGKLEFQIKWGISEEDLVKKLMPGTKEVNSFGGYYEYAVDKIFYIENIRHVQFQKRYCVGSLGYKNAGEIIKPWPESLGLID